MSLCNPALVEALSRCFVAVVVDVDKISGQSMVGSAQAARIGQIVRRSIESAPNLPTVRFHVFEESGEVTQMPTNGLPAQVVSYAREHHLAAGEPVRYRSNASSSPGSGGLQLRVVSRFSPSLTLADIGRRYAPIFGLQQYQAPGRDWIVLPLSAVSALLPEGREWHDVAPSVAASIVSHLYPPFPPPQRRVHETSMQTRVLSMGAGRETIGLRATYVLEQPGVDGGALRPYPENWVQGEMEGFIELDPTTHVVSRFELASTRSVDCARDGRRYPFSVCAHLVPAQGDSACP